MKRGGRGEIETISDGLWDERVQMAFEDGVPLYTSFNRNSRSQLFPFL